MQQPKTVQPLKTMLAQLVQNPKKGMFYLMGVESDTKKPYLWLSPDAFTKDEITAAKAGTLGGTPQDGVVVWDKDNARPVFGGATQPSATFTKWILSIASAGGAEKLKTATYKKMAKADQGKVAARGVESGVALSDGGGISDDAAEGVGKMFADAEEDARKQRFEKAKSAQGQLARILKEQAGTLKEAPSFRAAVMAASEAGALLRSRSPNVDEIEPLLQRAVKAYKDAQAEASKAPKPQETTPSSSTTPSGTSGTSGGDGDEDEDEDEEDENAQSSSPSSSGQQPKKSAGYDPSTGQYLGRPKKPDNLKGVDEAGDPLTAHHLYPWNKLRTDLNAALLDLSGKQMQKVLAFAEHTPPSGFYEELAKQPAQRSKDFVEWVNAAAKALCWGPANIFMGPLNTKRGDDPGEKLDVSKMKSGMMTPASAVAELTNKQGGIAQSSKLVERFAKNVRDAQRDDSGKVQAREYDQQGWEDDGSGKRVQRKKVAIKEGGGNISLDDDKQKGWTPATKTTKGSSSKPKEVKPSLSEEEIQRLREEAETRKQQKEQEKQQKKDDSDDEEGPGVGGLFDD